MSAAATANLETATRDILLAWERARETWRDSKSQQFGRTFIEPLPELAVQGRDAMAHLAGLLKKINYDCD